MSRCCKFVVLFVAQHLVQLDGQALLKTKYCPRVKL